MRLLQLDENGQYALTADLPSKDIPAYAILSHTWGPEEVVFTDLSKPPEGWQHKSGFDKIRFCADQAKRDGLNYFWVDTCCIDKSNSIELQTAINSMFRWYRNAKRCYVFLPDVSDAGKSTVPQESPAWEQALRDSRWFSRGWTLQELIAPHSVEFYSKEGIRLGDKESLETLIRDITNIPTSALRGAPLSNFTIKEREAWAHCRQTTLEEDIVYCLLGIFDIYMPLIYGETKERAQRRLREEIQKVLKGNHTNDFSVSFSLSEVPETQYFVGRQEEMAELRTALRSDGTRRVVCLQGLGGMGKTQLAVAYAKLYRDDYSAIFWFNIKDEISLQQSFTRVARQILQQHPHVSPLSALDLERNQDQVIEAVKAWLSLPDNTRWLIVYDNYDNPRLSSSTNSTGTDIQRYFPTGFQGAIIITTQLSEVDLGHRIRIKQLEVLDDSFKLLSATSGRVNLKKDIDARKLIDKLDGLPLALATAGAYLRHVPISLGEYLRHYERSWTRIHADTPTLPYQDSTLDSTWHISFKHVEEQCPLAAHLLRWWAYYDNEDIWFELLHPSTKTSNGPAWIYDLTDELKFNHAMGLLHKYGFVEPHFSTSSLTGSRGYSIHNCLHSWSIDSLNQNSDHRLSNLALYCIASCVSSCDDPQLCVLQRRLLVHATKSCARNIDPDEDSTWAFNKLGRLYYRHGKVREAKDMYLRVLQWREEALGPEHQSTLETLHSLGTLNFSLGNIQEAEEMLLRALQGMENVLGSDHLSTLDAVHGMGTFYLQQGKNQEAEEMLSRALQGKEDVLGQDHPSTLDTIDGLGKLYKKQGKLQKAERMSFRALQGKRKAWGPDHPSTLKTTNILGLIYLSQARLDEAEVMLMDALCGFEEALGPAHPLTLRAVSHVALLYKTQGKEAERLYIRALQGYNQSLGPVHPLTLRAVSHVALLYKSQGKMQEAEKLYFRALQGYEKAWGADHKYTLSIIHTIANFYFAQGKFQEAEDMYSRTLHGYERAYGPEILTTHRPAINVKWNLGKLHHVQNKPSEARDFYMQALVSLEAMHGAVDPDVRDLRKVVSELDKVLPHESMAAESVATRTSAVQEDGTVVPSRTSRQKRRDAFVALFRRSKR